MMYIKKIVAHNREDQKSAPPLAKHPRVVSLVEIVQSTNPEEIIRRKETDAEDFFSSMPKELTSEILTHLPPNEQSVALVCRKFYEVTREDWYWQLQYQKKFGPELIRPKQNHEPGWAKRAFINEVSKRFVDEITNINNLDISQTEKITRMKNSFIKHQQLLIPGAIFQISRNLLNLAGKKMWIALFEVGGSHLTGDQVFTFANAVFSSNKIDDEDTWLTLEALFKVEGSHLTGNQVFAFANTVLSSNIPGQDTWVTLKGLFEVGGSHLTGDQVFAFANAVLSSNKMSDQDTWLTLKALFKAGGSHLTGDQVFALANAVLSSNKISSQNTWITLRDLFEAGGSHLTEDHVFSLAKAVLSSNKMSGHDILVLLRVLSEARGSNLTENQVYEFANNVFSNKIDGTDIWLTLRVLCEAKGSDLVSLLNQNSTLNLTEKRKLSILLTKH